MSAAGGGGGGGGGGRGVGAGSNRVGCIPGKFGFFLEREVEHMLDGFFFFFLRNHGEVLSAAARRPRGRWRPQSLKDAVTLRAKDDMQLQGQCKELC